MIAFPVTSPATNGEIPTPRVRIPTIRPLPRPALRFSPTAWSKLLYLRDRGVAEIGAFGIAPAQDPLLVTEVQLVRQQSSHDALTLDDASVADYFDEQVLLGRHPEQFARIWIRIQSGSSVEPSRIDEATCWRCFGRTDWIVLCLLGRNGQISARLRFHVGPGGWLRLPVSVDFRHPFAASAFADWEREYQDNVITEEPF